MRNIAIICALALALPVVIADHGAVAPEHAIPIGAGDFYVVVCANHHEKVIAGSVIVGDAITDCLATGIWQESNGVAGIQVRAGVTHGSAGYAVYSADTRILP